MAIMRKPHRYEDPHISGINRRKTHASFYYDSSKSVSLNGKWDFKYVNNPESCSNDLLFGKVKGFDKIKVPSVWQLQGYDQMWYTDRTLQFPIHPPFVPNENPCGIYRRTFNLNKEWLKNKTIIHFGGVDSAFDIYVNKKYVGFSKVSRIYAEFDLSKYVHEGENEICVVVYKYSDGTYLEDQDEWWFNGIYRDVTLINEPKHAIRDCVVNTTLNKTYKNGKVEISCVLDKAEPISYNVRNDNQVIERNIVLSKSKNVSICFELKDVATWTAETPNLYELTIQTKTHEISVRFGFRTIEVIDGAFCVNGQNILINGVNHHDFSPTEGRYITKDIIKKDILLMKQFNINAIRCSHYPSIPELYDYADELGMYVIDEADLECDCMGYIENYDLISNDPYYKDAYVDRGTRMVMKDRNHPSIIMWSLGNESGFGCNFVSMKKEILKLDRSRLIHYEGDKDCKVSDVYTTMYTHLDKLEQIAKKKGKPHVHCEYCHAMGNGAGNFNDYQQLYRKYRRLTGGFIWEWYDHGIASKDKNGKTYYRYGGDFGEHPHNGNFCIDGLLQPDRTPSTALYELKQVICPIDVQYKNNKLIIHNYYDFIDTSKVHFDYEFKCMDEVLDKGTFKLNVLPHNQKSIPLSCTKKPKQVGYDTYLNISVRLNEKQEYANKNYEIGSYQFLYMKAVIVSKKHPNLYKTTYQIKNHELLIQNKVINAKFNLIDGTLKSLMFGKQGMIEDGPKLSVYRATIDNDMAKREDWLNKYLLQTGSEQLESYQINKTSNCITIKMNKYFSCISQSWGFDLEYTYQFFNDGKLEVHIKGKDKQVGKLEPEFLPRLGVEMKLNKQYKNLTYYGLGPRENYCDSMQGCHMDKYDTSIDKLFVNYVYPQENGHHQDLRWLALHNKKGVHYFKANQKMGFNISYYDDKTLEESKHTIDLKKNNYVTLHLDAAMSGLGSNSCGPEQLDKYKVKRKPFEMSFEIGECDANKMVDEGQKRYL